MTTRRMTGTTQRHGDEHDLTYSLSIKGEQHTYTVEAWLKLTADQLCAVLGDLTGYRADWLRQTLPDKFDRFGYATVHPAAIGDWGEPPRFLICSSNGTKMPPRTMDDLTPDEAERPFRLTLDEGT
jgi:hypothetical protein